MLFIVLFLNPSELGHIDKATIEDNFCLRSLSGPLQSEGLDSTLIFQSDEQLLCHDVDITQNDTLVTLTIRQSQLLNRNLILFRLTHRFPEILGLFILRWRIFNERLLALRGHFFGRRFIRSLIREIRLAFLR